MLFIFIFTFRTRQNEDDGCIWQTNSHRPIGRNRENSNTIIIISIFPFKNLFSATLTHPNVVLWAFKSSVLRYTNINWCCTGQLGESLNLCIKNYQGAKLTSVCLTYILLCLFTIKCYLWYLFFLMITIFARKRQEWYVSRTA